MFRVGRELNDLLGQMGNRFDKLGRALRTSVNAYNETVATVEGRVLVQARRFRDLKVTEKELKDRVAQIQDRHWALRQIAMTALIGLIADLKAAKDAGKPDADLATARYLQRRAQFYLDFVEAENSTGFHAPQEAARILGESLNFARQGQLAVRDPTFKPTVDVVNIPAPPAPPPPSPGAR